MIYFANSQTELKLTSGNILKKVEYVLGSSFSQFYIEF